MDKYMYAENMYMDLSFSVIIQYILTIFVKLILPTVCTYTYIGAP